MKKLVLIMGAIVFIGTISFSNNPVLAMLEARERADIRRSMLSVGSKEILDEQFKEELSKHLLSLMTHVLLYGKLEGERHAGKTLIDLHRETISDDVFTPSVFCQGCCPSMEEISIERGLSPINWTASYPLKISLRELRGIDGIRLDGELLLSMSSVTVKGLVKFTMDDLTVFTKETLLHAFRERAFLEEMLLSSVPLTAEVQIAPPPHLRDLGEELQAAQILVEQYRVRLAELAERKQEEDATAPIAGPSSEVPTTY